MARAAAAPRSPLRELYLVCVYFVCFGVVYVFVMFCFVVVLTLGFYVVKGQNGVSGDGAAAVCAALCAPDTRLSTLDLQVCGTTVLLSF
jgi:hypothetical protein